MNKSEIFSHIDHTKLSPTTTWEEIRTLCREASENKAASVCIPPCYIEAVRESYPEIKICTVIGFPLGYSTKETKIFEAGDAVTKGADEVDMVVNLCQVKNGQFFEITKEIKEIKAACRGKTLKVIIETCYLTEEEKIKLCRCVTEGGADYIKTSTGFGTAGAQKSDIELFRQNIGENVKIKAAGGIRTKEDMEEFLSLGCDRIGTSSGVKALCEKE